MLKKSNKVTKMVVSLRKIRLRIRKMARMLKTLLLQKSQRLKMRMMNSKRRGLITQTLTLMIQLRFFKNSTSDVKRDSITKNLWATLL